MIPLNEEYIFKENNEFIIRKEINGDLLDFGHFNSLDEAIEKRDELADDGWPYIRKESLKRKKRFGKYIYLENNKYVVSRKIKNFEIIYGKYDHLKDAQSLKRILIDNAWYIGYRKRGDYRYISKSQKRYSIAKHVNNKSRYFGSFSTLADALNRRDELINNNWDMPNDTLLENIGVYHWNEEEAYIAETVADITILRIVGNKIIFYGFYRDIEYALNIRDQLIENDWDVSKLDLEIIPYNRKDVTFDYIKNFYPYYYINKEIDGRLKNFGEYTLLEDAILIRNELIKNNWDYTSYLQNIFEKSSERNTMTFKFDFNPYDDKDTTQNKANEDFEKFDENIYYLSNTDMYYVRKEIDGVVKVFGVFQDMFDAIDRRLECIKNNWNPDMIQYIEPKDEPDLDGE